MKHKCGCTVSISGIGLWGNSWNYSCPCGENFEEGSMVNIITEADNSEILRIIMQRKEGE